MQAPLAQTYSTDCCIVGGGPAGLMLGYLLALAGVSVVVVEKHADFLRDFRGDTIHPSTLQILHHLGLLDDFLALPHQRVERLKADIGDESVTLANFSWLPVKCRFIAFMPQWDFLNFITAKASQLAGFTLLKSTHFDDLIYEDQRVCGIYASSGAEKTVINAKIVVGADGRHSKVREKARLTGRSFGSPRDVVWFRLPKHPDDPHWSSGHQGPKQNFIMIDRGDFWQCGLSIPKGEFQTIISGDFNTFKHQVATVAPFPAERLTQLKSHEALKLLSIRIDRLDAWAKEGLLCIGDAAHAMSPIGGVGVNLAIQDAVATANLLATPLRDGQVSLRQLKKVQKRRQFPTSAMQFIQIKMSGRKRDANTESPMPRLVKRLPFLPYVFGWIIGMGFRTERPRKALTNRRAPGL